MALHDKWDALETLRPDVAVIPEASAPSRWGNGDARARASGHCWIGPNARKGLSAFSFGEYRLSSVPRSPDQRADAMAASVTGPVSFTLIAVWARAPKYVQHLHDVIDEYRPLLERGDAVLAGDFNSNTVWDGLHGTKCHSSLVRRLDDEFGMASANPYAREEVQGAETEPTFFLHADERKPYHIDYVFLPRRWLGSSVSCALGPRERWLRLSDHRPMIVEFSPDAM